MKQQYNFATYYRVLGMVFILLCHFTQESGNVYLNMSAQFFNIGVSMFIILSGFLFGIQGGQSNHPIQWLKRRLKRIYIPYALFVVSLFIIHICYGKNILKWDWLWLSLGLQGSVVGVLGAEQTWFITPILLCYLATPIFAKCCELSKCRRTVIIGILVIMPIVLAFIPPAYPCTLFSPFCWYGLAYFVGIESRRVRINAKGVFVAFLVLCGSFGMRLIARAMIDGTILYDRIITSYTQSIAAFAMFYITAFLQKRSR